MLVHIFFRNEPINNVFELIEPINSSVVGEQVEFKYKINNILDGCTVIFNLDENTELGVQI